MVETLAPYDKAIKDVKADLPNIIRQILIKNKVKILNILKEEQLAKGLGSDGALLGTYSRNTELISIFESPKPRRAKVEGQPYNFDWTGSFFDKFDMMFEDEQSFTLFSRDSKAKMLEETYGELTTLTEQNNKRINEEILRPQMYDIMIKRLFT